MIGFIIWFVGFIIVMFLIKRENESDPYIAQVTIGEAMFLSLFSWLMVLIWFIVVFVLVPTSVWWQKD